MIRISRPWLRQPPIQTGVDAGNPLAHKLSFLHTPSMRKEAVGGRAPSSYGARSTERGTVCLNGSSESFSYAPFSQSTNVTMMMLVKPAVIGTRRDVSGSGGPASAYNQFTLAANANFNGANSSGEMACWTYSSAFKSYSTYAGGLIDEWQLLIATLDGSSSIRVYKNGVLYVAPASSVSSSWHQGTSCFYGSADAKSALGAMWNRLLSEQEIAALSKNPWQLFAPLHLDIPYAAASGAPTISALSAINVTTTSAQPRITYTF